MSGRNDLVPRCPDLCRELADYYEAEARYLRTHARGLESAELHEWRRNIRVWRSGKMARALAENGMPQKLAVNTTARRLQIEPETVTAQVRFREAQMRKRHKERRENEVRRLAKKGHSLRDIAARLRLSKSRVQQILKVQT